MPSNWAQGLPYTGRCKARQLHHTTPTDLLIMTTNQGELCIVPWMVFSMPTMKHHMHIISHSILFLGYQNTYMLTLSFHGPSTWQPARCIPQGGFTAVPIHTIDSLVFGCNSKRLLGCWAYLRFKESFVPRGVRN